MNFSKCSLLYTLISALSLSALLALTGCFSNNMGTISIDLGSGNNTGSKASQAPSNITQFTLKISSPGMNTIEGTYPAATSEISIEVPAGNNRLIELTSDINPSDPGAVLSYKGSSLVNLNSGETKTVILSMKVNETKLIIPDFGNNRVIQVTSLSGDTTAINAAWQDLTAAGAGWSLRPGDVDFDSQGRIYIASAYGGSGDTNNCVVRVDNIAGDNSIKFASASYDNGVEALAVDRNNNLVYYATNSSTATEKLYRSNLDNSSSSSLSVSGGVEAIGSIYGMTVDNDGKLYISGKNGPGASRIFKYDPATQQVTISYAGSMVFPNDIMFKNNSVYVLDINGAEGYHVFQLNLDLTVISSNIGTRTGDTSTVGKFYGASRFLGKMNPYFYILDEDAGGTADRIIYLEDFAGTGWKSYGETGSGIGQFGFYNVGG